MKMLSTVAQEVEDMADKGHRRSVPASQAMHVLDELRGAAAGLILALVLAGCAPAAPGASQSSAPGPQSSPKRLLAAIRGDPHVLYNTLNLNNAVPGIDAVEDLVNAGLSNLDQWANPFAVLAEAVPSLDNGLWKVFPDGRMETTWRIKPGAQWHDGTSYSSQDLLFTGQVVQDKELADFRNVVYESIEVIAAPDPRTVTVKWKQPYIEADRMFSRSLALPLPKHLLERGYAENKAGFTQHPYFSQDFVGTGPFSVREWVKGSHLVLQANDRFPLGSPKIDEIEVRFIVDSNTLVANVLAGTVELTLGRRLSLEQGLTVREQWREGTMEVAPSNMIMVYPQFINPNPPIIADLRFRRALLHALDRQEMAATLQAGYSSVAQTWLSPNQPQYEEIEARVPRYEFDARRAAGMIEALGYVKSADGTFRDAGGRVLSVEIRTSAGDDLQEKAMFATADHWRRVGLAVETSITPPQRQRDLEYRSTFPSFDLKSPPNDVRGLRRLHSSQTPLPETNYGGGNSSRYINPDFDALLDRFATTIPVAERTQVLGQIIYHIADQLILFGLFYDTQPVLIANRLRNVTVAKGPGSSLTWNAHEWDVRGG